MTISHFLEACQSGDRTLSSDWGSHALKSSLWGVVDGKDWCPVQGTEQFGGTLLTACQVEPAVSSDFSNRTTSLIPALARW